MNDSLWTQVGDNLFDKEYWRGQFAIAAMPLVYARHENKLTALELAYESFRIADAMLKQMEKENDGQT